MDRIESNFIEFDRIGSDYPNPKRNIVFWNLKARVKAFWKPGR